LLGKIEDIPNNFEVYNIASGNLYKIKDLVDMLISMSSVKNIEIRQDPQLYRKVDIIRMLGDYSKLHNKTGWKPVIEINQTLKDTLEYWRSVV